MIGKGNGECHNTLCSTWLLVMPCAVMVPTVCCLHEVWQGLRGITDAGLKRRQGALCASPRMLTILFNILLALSMHSASYRSGQCEAVPSVGTNLDALNSGVGGLVVAVPFV